MKKRLAILVLLSLALLYCSACQKKGGGKTGGRKLQVITTLFPMYDFARTIAGDKAEVLMLLPPGVEPHGFEPKPEDILKVNRADLFIYTNRYMEPWAADLLKGAGNSEVLVVDAGSGVKFLPATGGNAHAGNGEAEEAHHHGGMDPHIWLDLGNAQIMVDNIAGALARKDPANRDYYLGRAAAYKAQLAALDKRFQVELAGCATRRFISGGHYAFGYLAARYGLAYVAASAISADAEPTPKKLAELVKLVKDNHLQYVFYEELLAPTVADTIARETGVRLLKLNGIHNVSKDELARGVTFLSLMEQNLANLKVGLQCR